jgi:hypothetical protein
MEWSFTLDREMQAVSTSKHPAADKTVTPPFQKLFPLPLKIIPQIGE